MEGIKSLLGSEKAIAGGTLIICATVLVAIGLMPVADWQSFSRDIFITYVAGKTVQGGVSMWTEAQKAPQELKVTKTESKTELKTEDKTEHVDVATKPS